MKKLLTLLGLIPILIFGQKPTMRQVASAGTAITKLPSASTATIAATDTMMVFKGGVWVEAKMGVIAPTLVAGTGISISTNTITNTAPNQTVTLTGAGTTTVSGTYPTYTVTGGGGLTVGTTAIANGTVGALLFEGAGNVLQEDATQLFWDNTNNRLGVGLTTLTATIHAKGSTSDASASGLLVEAADGTDNLLVRNNGKIEAGLVGGNITIGKDAGFNTTTAGNTVFGVSALSAITTGGYNTANGYQALFSNTTGSYNVATGTRSLYANTTGLFNTANGYEVLYYNTTGSNNVAIGNYAGKNQTTASNQLFIDNQDRSTAGAELTSSLVYGKFSATVNSQELHFNSGIVDINGRLETKQGT